MGFDQVKAGKDVPNDINVIIEISAQGDPIKFEVDKDSGAIFVDRFMGTSMRYPHQLRAHRHRPIQRRFHRRGPQAKHSCHGPDEPLPC